MELGLHNKVIMITSNAGGIGEAIIRVLTDEGAIAGISGKWEGDNRNLQQNEPAACEKAVRTIYQKYGRIDGLVNNGGINDSRSLDSDSNNLFRNSLDDYLGHYFLMTHFALSYLKISHGPIININAKTANTRKGNRSAYVAADGGLNALTREWAVEMLKYGIRVNAILIDEYTKLENQASAWSGIAQTVAFLLSEKSSHTTGQLIHADAGRIPVNRP